MVAADVSGAKGTTLNSLDAQPGWLRPGRAAVAGSLVLVIYWHMAKPKPDSPVAQAEALALSERLLLFCVASRTEWERVVTGATVTAMVIKGLIQRDPAGELHLTKEGRAVLSALLGQEDE
jgi:hypothetical protein